MSRWLRRRAFLRGPETAVVGFALRGLTRSRLHQFIFAVVLGSGLALLVGQIAWMADGRTLVAARPSEALERGDSGAAARHSVFDHRAAGGVSAAARSRRGLVIQTRRRSAHARLGAERRRDRFSVCAVAPAWLVAVILQPPLLGYETIPCMAMTALAGLTLVEMVLIGWRRIPYSCSYLPGKRHLTYTVAMLLAAYGLFVAIGANLLRASLVHPARMMFVGGLLLAAFASLRRGRLRTLGALPLEFEDDDPAAVIVMSLGPSGR